MCKHLSVRPISLWDSEYGCAPFILKTADIKADKLMRLRSNLCLWTAPNQILEQNDSKLGHIRISVWHGLHFRAAAKHPISLLRVERLNVDGSLRIIKPLWLAWVGEEMPPQEQRAAPLLTAVYS